jgi:hypothetical protein
MLLCVRSLIEHRAFAVWLPKEVGVSLDALASEVQAANPLPRNAVKVEDSLAKFLAAQAKASKEQQRSWVMVEGGGVRTARPNLGRIVEEAFPEDDRFHTLYALSSAAMHGRSGRGSDLMLGGENRAMQTRRIGLLVLERICGRDEEMDHLSAALVQSVRLGHTADFGGTSAAATMSWPKKRSASWTGRSYQASTIQVRAPRRAPFASVPILNFSQRPMLCLNNWESM